ncbi:F-box only protein 15-like isoform X1 [Sebastes umbrosus]|uniref:F-box only protein 15-like isoform X1 n=2 Tax=Sebastes umbrosus TaxID=72105 RepID=UPI00189ED532|nr:F-box only protein 15-like isoform X1 [Sebastes umbrosus]
MAGRGEFLPSFLEGLRRNPVQPGPFGGLGRPQPGPGDRQPGPANVSRGRTGGKRRKRRPKVAPSCVSGNSFPEPRTKACFPQTTSPSKENLLERLPSEILLKILSYLDASSLSCISHVSKLFHQLANDDVIWHKIYMSDFGSQAWRPKSAAGDASPKVDPVEVEERSAGYWKKMFFRTVAGQDMNKWRKEMRDVSPYTGLPRLTEWVLRNLNVSWELTVCGYSGQEMTMEQSRAYFFETSVIVQWSGGRFPDYHQIRNIQLYGVRKETPTGPKARMPGWRSLILKLDMKTHYGCFIGKDSLVTVRQLQPGFIIGTWRGENSVAFIMVTLHFHKLVEKSLLGSPVCPYSEPVDLCPVDKSDPEFGLHGYSLHFVLHNTGTEIMSGHFRQLSCRKVQIQNKLVELRVINRTDLSQHRSLSGSIKLPWKSEALEGSVEISGCILLGVAIYLKVSKDGNKITDEAIPGIDLMIAIGVIIMVLGFLGCCGAIRENRCLLLLFFISLLVIFILLLALGILGAVDQKKVKDWVKERLEKFTPLVSQPEDVKKDLKALQKELKCCGLVNGASDWGPTSPESCRCNATETNCGPSAIYTTPCSTQVIKLMEKNMEVVLGIAFAIAILLIFGMVFSMILYCQIGKKEPVTTA